MGIERESSRSVAFEEYLRRVFNGEYECRHAPLNPVETGEVVLGTLTNPVARSVFSFLSEMQTGGKKFYESLPDEPPEDKEEVLRLQCEVHKLRNRIECTKSLFWELVYSAYPKARNPSVSVGIRVDWTVVIFKSTDNGSPFLRGILCLD